MKHGHRGLPSILPAPASITRQQALQYLPRVVLEEAVREGKLKESRKGRKMVFYSLREVTALNESLTQTP